MTSHKKTFGFFNSYSLWGGGEKWNIEMMEKLHQNGYSCTLFSPENGGLKIRVLQKSLAKCFDIVVNKYSYFNPLHLYRFYKIFKKNPVDILIFNSFIDVRAAAIAARLAGIKTIIMRVGTPIAPKEKMSYRLAFQYGLDDIAVISEEIKRVFQTDAPRMTQKMSFPMFYNGVDVDDYQVKEPSEDLEIIFGNCSRLTMQKGYHHLIDAVDKIKHKKFKVLIAGEGELEKELSQLVKEKGLHHIIKFVGHVENTSNFYQKIDVLSFTSSYEGTARTILEAWASGLPVISFDISSMGDMVTHQKDGLLIKPYDTDAYSQAMSGFIDRFSDLKEMGIQGRKKVEKSHNKKIQYQKWFDYLTSL